MMHLPYNISENDQQLQLPVHSECSSGLFVLCVTSATGKQSATMRQVRLQR
jgi:hypothetical protein